MAVEVLISYAIANKLTADASSAGLELSGIHCWIAPHDVLQGMEYAESIIEAIEKVRGMVLIFSSNANRSNQVKREVEREVHRGIPIMPFRFEDVPPARALEYYISSPHWLDALTPPLDEHLKQLALTLQILLDRASGQTSQAPMGRRPETPANRVSQAAAVPAAKTPSLGGTPVGAGSGVSDQQGNLPAHPTTASGTAGGASPPAKPKFPIGVTIFIAILAFLLVGFICVGLLEIGRASCRERV